MKILHTESLNRHLRLTVAETTRVFVIGDLHGEIDQLITLLAEVEFNQETDLLIATGDLIDRGQDSLACLRLHKTMPSFYSVLGNHEQLAINALKTEDYGLWFYNGGGWYADITDEERNEADTILSDVDQNGFLTISIIKTDPNNKQTKHYVVAHADIPHHRYEFGKQYDQSEFDYLIWNRESVNRLNKGETLSYLGADQFIFGHTPQKAITHFSNVSYIDTAACYHTKYSKLSYIQI